MTEEFFRTCRRPFSEWLSDDSAAPSNPPSETLRPSLAGVAVSDLLAQYGSVLTAQPSKKPLPAVARSVPRTPPKAPPVLPPASPGWRTNSPSCSEATEVTEEKKEEVHDDDDDESMPDDALAVPPFFQHAS